MTIQEHSSRIYYPYTGPGDYTFNFRIYDDVDIVCQILFATGVVKTLDLGTDYTVTVQSGSDGGTVHTTYTLGQGETGQLYISRGLPAVQLTDYVNNHPFDVEILEKDLDYITILIQDGLRDLHDGTVAANWRGDWQANTKYMVKDLVVAGPDNNWYACLVEHTSTSSFSNDLAAGYWTLALDAGGITDDADRAETAANNAATSEANAATSETNAAQSASDAQDSADDAADSATLAQQAIDDTHAIAEGDSIRVTTSGTNPITSEISLATGAATWSDTADWNSDDLAVAGSAHWITRGDTPNGPGDHEYFYSFCFEYETKDGSGNLTQLAIGYESDKIFMRHRHSGTWSSWVEFASELWQITENTTFYIDNSGNDSTGDGSYGNPWKTVTHALAVLSRYRITNNALVTIHLSAEDHIEPTHGNNNGLTWSHPQSESIRLVGADQNARLLFNTTDGAVTGITVRVGNTLNITNITLVGPRVNGESQANDTTIRAIKCESGTKIISTSLLQIENFLSGMWLANSYIRCGVLYIAGCHDYLTLLENSAGSIKTLNLIGYSTFAAYGLQADGGSCIKIWYSLSIMNTTVACYAHQSGQILLPISNITLTDNTTDYSPPAFTGSNTPIWGTGGAYIWKA